MSSSSHKHTHSENQGRNHYSMYVRSSLGEQFFGDYPTRTRAHTDALLIVRDTGGAFYSITLEDNFDEELCWDLQREEGRPACYQWVQVDYDEDED